ncbi:MAG: biotin--[acetyl-CoA-carboxylase] ligase [Planctomycetota bacterium]|jgi:BirA family biotin operon repressor/biotin-[acetyl-CoA-carboxylase] ligase
MQFKIPEWVDQTPSTNQVLTDRIRAGQGLPTGAIVAAHEQTAGRGRLGRGWFSPARQNLTFSFALAEPAPLCAVPSLPMATSLGIVDFLQSLGVKGVRPKWPNDVLVGTKKIAGILAEVTDLADNYANSIVVGIGLNINMGTNDIASIDKPSTSVLVETGARHAPSELLPQLLDCLCPWIDRWLVDGFAGIESHWSERASFNGMSVTIEESPGVREEVEAVGYGTSGELLVLRPGESHPQAVWAADIVRE